MIRLYRLAPLLLDGRKGPLLPPPAHQERRFPKKKDAVTGSFLLFAIKEGTHELIDIEQCQILWLLPLSHVLDR